MEQNPEPTIINVIGAPASGKGTLCKKLAADHGFGHVSIGDTLRALLSSPNTDPEIVKKVKNAELLPIEALGPILKARIDAEKQTGSKVILLDGFPRQLDQAAPVEAQIGSPAVVLFFDCPEDLALKRFLTRKLDGRETDDEKTFAKRYQEFARLNASILEHYRSRKILIEIDTSGETEVSYQKLIYALEETAGWELTDRTRID